MFPYPLIKNFETNTDLVLTCKSSKPCESSSPRSVWTYLFIFDLSSLQPLDFETKKAYTFKVEASNVHLDHRFHSAGPFKDTATVKISVLDVEEPPVFSKPLYTMEVYEDTPVGTIIGAVTAQDLDVGSSAVR